MKTLHLKLLAVLVVTLLPLKGFAQVNSGSDGHDGAFNPASNLVVNMADHPDGIYHYTSVNIPSGVTVTFTPNANNKPVVWLVQGSCTIAGTVSLKGAYGGSSGPGIGGPGGWLGGTGGPNGTAGQGPGGGPFNQNIGGHGSFGTTGSSGTWAGATYGAGPTYGNIFLLPLIGGSGGSGERILPQFSPTYYGGGGGGGAILIVASGVITISGSINCDGGDAQFNYYGTYTSGGCGSGGAIRLVAGTINGGGVLSTKGGSANDSNYPHPASGGTGRVRLDAYQNNFSGTFVGVSSSGFQPIILPVSGQGIQLGIASVAGATVPANPSGVQASPDIIIPAQQSNPIPIVVSCTNIPLNTSITVIIHPVSGADVQAVGINNAGTAASSTATVSINMPRGGGIIYAKAVTGIGGTASVTSPDSKTRSIADTGWTADGERFAKVEIVAALGSKQQVTYITESGKRYSLAAR